MHKLLMVFGVCLFGHTLSLAQGLVLDDNAYEKSPRKVRLLRGDYSQVPDSSSLKIYSPGPGNQLTYATSVGWALAWGARTMLYAQENKISDLKEIRKHVFSPGYIYELAKDKEDGDCSAGITLEDGLNVLKTKGVPRISTFFTFCGGEISPEVEASAATNKITDYARLFDVSDPNELKISAVKKSLAEQLPVVIGMITPPSFGRARVFWQPTESTEASHGGQALLVVGYNDSKYGGAFEVMNNQGRDWGNDGYIWVRYTDFVRFVKYGYELFVMPDEANEVLSGEMTLQLRSGNTLSVNQVSKGYYKLNVALPSGAQFKIGINSDKPVFIYAFSSDLTKKCYKLFPFTDDISSTLTYNRSSMAIPDEDHYIQLDNTPGTDYLCILYSKEELDLQNIIRKVESHNGDFKERVHHALGKSFNKEAGWVDDRLLFNARISKGGTVATFIEIPHN